MEGPVAGLAPNAPQTGASLLEHPDRRIAELARLVDSGDFDLLSLDVFDTVVYRMAPRPTDVFFELAALLLERRMIHASSSPESFVRERMQAEGRARGRKAGHEVTLEEIWAQFPRGYLRRCTVDECLRAELECERRSVRVYEPMRALVAFARERALKVAFVSDTYFTRRQIHQFTGLDADWTIVSCEHGLSKWAGLHRVLLEKSHVPAERILHAGDHREADIEGPGRLGIARYWFRRFPAGFHAPLTHELPEAHSRRAPLVTLPESGLSALRSQVMAQCESDHERWGAGVLGPVVAGYAQWLVQRCAEAGITRVFCLMREGRAIREAIEAVGAPLEAHEVYLSRFVALKASIVRGTVDEIARFVVRPSATRCGKVLAQLGLDPADVPQHAPGDKLTRAETLELVRHIASHPALRRKVVESSALARARMLRHLTPMLPPRGGLVALADLGYKGTIQMGLQLALDHERLGVTTHGLYLVTGGDVHETQGTGGVVEGWLAENGQPIAMAHTFMRSPEIFEQSLMADCGTTLGHEDDGTPRLDAFHIPQGQRDEIAAVQRGLRRFVPAWARQCAEQGEPDAACMREMCRCIVERAIARPSDMELDLFAHWQHDENFGSESVRTLTDAVDLHDWERSHLSAHQLASLPHSQVYWPFGLAWNISAAMGEAVASIFLRTAEPFAFDSAGGPRPATFLWDDGRGWRDEHCQPIEYTSNSRGSCWLRATVGVSGEPLTGVGLAFAAPRALLRVAGIRVHWRSSDGCTDSETFASDALQVIGAECIAPAVWLAGEEATLVTATLPAREDFHGTVDADFFFTLLAEA